MRAWSVEDVEVASWWAEAMAAARKWPDERREMREMVGLGWLEELRKAGGISCRLDL